jgi:chorismate-pyruvate lyase
MTAILERDQIASIAWETLAGRFSTQEALHLRSLSPLQRILLTTDGTLTELLECYLLEPIIVDKLAEFPIYINGDNPLALDETVEVTERKILLKGKHSGQNWLYAESLLINERLHSQFEHGLINTNKPIGKLWMEYKIETFKETLYCFREPAGELSTYFDISPEEPLWCRTYRVFSQRQPVMLITEKFPSSFYTQPL